MRKTAILLLLSLLPLSAGAQGLLDFFGFGVPQAKEKGPVSLAWDVNLDYNFDNREFDPSEGLFSRSSTIHNVALTPSIGVDIRQSSKVDHRVMLGIDVAKNLGESPTGADDRNLANWGLFHEITLYYRIRALAGKTLITGYAGAFPRSMMSRGYGPAFFSDSLLVFDRNIEGMLIKFKRPKARYEVGCDWMGMYGSKRRERFLIFSSGESSVLPWLILGWNFTGYHYAHAVEYGNVCDNILAEPYIRFDIAKQASFQELSLKLGVLAGAQRLRDVDMNFTVPVAPEAILTLRKWDVCLRNNFYFSTSSLMPFYNRKDPGGFKYGSDFYFGDPFFRMNKPGREAENGFYDRLELFYEPNIAGFIDLKVGVVAHFAPTRDYAFGFAGWQQRVGLTFNLDRLLHPEKKITRNKRKSAVGGDYFL